MNLAVLVLAAAITVMMLLRHTMAWLRAGRHGARSL